MTLPKLPPIDVFSFWLGFAAAALLAFVLFSFREPLGRARAALRATLRRLREELLGGMERRVREEVTQQAQTAHLAAAIFTLDQILVPPRLLIPPPPIDPTVPPGDEDLTAIIPNLPEWPDLPGLYRVPTLTVEEALAGRTNVVVLGAPGSGKTTLLAHLASRAAAGDEALFPGNPTPIWVHAGDLPLPVPAEGDVAQPLVAAAQMRASALTAPQIPGHLLRRLKQGACVVFVDGVDELPPAHVAEVAAWLQAFLKTYDAHRLIVAAGQWGYAPLVTRCGLAPVHMAPWGPADFAALIRKWGGWLDEARAKNRFTGPGQVEPAILRGWVSGNNQGRSVFEVTLKLWAAFTGDARGNRPGHWLDAYRLRLGIGARPEEAQALGLAALAMLADAGHLGVAQADLVQACNAAFAGPDGKPGAEGEALVDRLLRQRLLLRRAHDRVCFRHPLLLAHSAAAALAQHLDRLPTPVPPAWEAVLYFFAGSGDLTPVVGQILPPPPDLLYTNLLLCARWLRDAPATAPWRTEVFRRLSRLLIEKALPEALRLRALAGLVAANDPAVMALFKQVLASPDPFNRRLGTLGLGASGEPTMVPFLEPLFADPYLDVRWAAALALAVIASEPAVDALVQGLMQGEDAVRQACAQALARLPEEVGHPLLRQAVQEADLNTRHAAVWGLLATRADWALTLLNDMQINEKEWLVRNAAIEAVAQWETPPDRAPKPYVAPDSQGWLVAWAASQGTGVPPGRGAVEVLNRALREGDTANRCAAAAALSHLCDPALTRELYPALRDPEPLLREAAFSALAQVAAAAGQRLPATLPPAPAK